MKANCWKLVSMALVAVLPTLGVLHGGPAVAADYVPFTGEKSLWHDDFARYDFILDEATLAIEPFKRPDGEQFGIQDPPTGKRRCVVIAPKQAAAGNPWSWRGCYWDHQPQTEIELLRRGFHVAYISANANLKPDKTWDAWYANLTERHGLAAKPAFIGMSRGGEYAYTWSTLHPDKVSCIYADNPGMNPEALARLGDLAKADVPILHVCGSIDPILGRCSTTIETIYRQFGGRISVMIKEGAGHHPHSLRDPRPIADFIAQSFQPSAAPPPNFLRGRVTHTSFYSIANSFREFPKQGYYITCRGPWFSECYDRYSFELPGVEGAINVIVPKSAASGRPWVYRADFVGPDSAVDLALLANGFHIVTGPVPFNGDGPRLDAWNQLYQHLTANGFAKKPVLAGAGGAAGEAYAWAIANPEKVACIYAENPLLHANMTKAEPLDGLAALAKAGVPILHVCGSIDPLLASQTRVAQKRYEDAGGHFTLILDEGAAHDRPAPRDLKPILEFVLKAYSVIAVNSVGLKSEPSLSAALPVEAADGPRKRSANEVLLVFNENSPISKSVADDYAAKRKVRHVISINCVDSAVKADNETIAVEVYRNAIEEPIRAYLAAHAEIQFIVLTKGVPIRISSAETGERDERSSPETPLNASVDSQLAALRYKEVPDAVTIKIFGSGATGVGWANRYWNAKGPFSHVKFGGYLVTRLDAYTEADAKALVARALAAEQGLGSGSVLLDAQPIFGLGDKTEQPAPIKGTVISRESPWSDYNADMLLAHDLLKARGIPDELDVSEKFIGNRSDLLGYCSWGSNDARFSNKAYQSLSFAPGSICDTAVSTSGRTFLRTQGGQSLLADLVGHGLTCGKGYTDEPLLQAIASPSILMDRYTAGYTMAESFYAASHFVGWQDIVIGDPLCCPYRAKERAQP